MEDHLEFTDGSGNQFQGETNLGRVVTSLVGPTAVRRHSVIGVPAHGKSMGDALGFVIKVKVEEGVRCRRLLLQGTRNHVLYLAQHHPKPKGNPGAKEGMWVPQRFLYGFYSDDLWAKTPQHFSPSASKAFHSRSITLNRDRPTTVFSRKAFLRVPQLRRPSVRFPKLPCEMRNGSCEHCEVPARRPCLRGTDCGYVAYGILGEPEGGRVLRCVRGGRRAAP